jgi:hypothetical protein
MVVVVQVHWLLKKSKLMSKVFKPFFIFFLISCAATNVSAQLTPGNVELNKYQDSLLKITKNLFTASNNIDRFEQNSKFIKTLVTALKIPSSFDFGFDSLQTISVVKSPDHTFRIFSWYVPTVEGTYRFFGTVQLATRDGKLKLYPLIDDTEHITDLNQITTNKQWYGARYYEIVPLIVSGQNTSYVLLGWKGNNSKTSKKVIEVLSFVNDELKFGKTIFQGPKNSEVKNRIVFEYNKLNSMTLRLDKNEQMIVFDHLAPFDPNMEGNFEYYASDSSFDGYRLAGNQLKLMENIELKNDPDAKDDFYIDPKPKEIPTVKN